MKKKVAGVTLDHPQTSLHCRLFPFELVSEYRDRVFCRLSSVMRTTFLAEMAFSSFYALSANKNSVCHLFIRLLAEIWETDEHEKPQREF